MRIAGVIAEYNPFHEGHLYHLRQTKAAGADAVVAVMSGNYVQRGTPAIVSKWARAQAAAQCGADLVLELPVPWAIGRAQTFADGAVSALCALGVVDMLSFGSECGDTERLLRTAEMLTDPALDEAIRGFLSQGMPYAASREQAVRARFGDDAADVLQSANDTLALEYLLSAKRRDAAFTYHAVRRLGAHDAAFGSGYLCASEIRRRLCDGQAPEGCPPCMQALWTQYASRGAAPASLRYMERAVLQQLRSASAASLRALPDVSEGLENRILAAAREADSLDALYALAKTKRYTHARIRRIVLSAFLGVRQADIPAAVPYLRVLAIGQHGADILRLAKGICRVPILTRTAAADALDGEAKRLWDLEAAADERYALLLPTPEPAGEALRHAAFVLRG